MADSDVALAIRALMNAIPLEPQIVGFYLHDSTQLPALMEHMGDAPQKQGILDVGRIGPAWPNYPLLVDDSVPKGCLRVKMSDGSVNEYELR